MTMASPDPVASLPATETSARAGGIALALLALAACLPLVLSSYQVGLATQMLIFGTLALPFNPLGWFENAAVNQALVLNASSTGPFSGGLVYVEV